ncbi:hypothetical protein BHE74_00026563 [Ensete ventricosum]|nr:hypothetical protein BHE74_00026563 [Ensete ventricosum]RZS09480.1 hypothetical protein BHM03_00040559 [Ensete ventricosum]
MQRPRGSPSPPGWLGTLAKRPVSGEISTTLASGQSYQLQVGSAHARLVEYMYEELRYGTLPVLGLLSHRAVEDVRQYASWRQDLIKVDDDLPARLDLSGSAAWQGAPLLALCPDLSSPDSLSSRSGCLLHPPSLHVRSKSRPVSLKH